MTRSFMYKPFTPTTMLMDTICRWILIHNSESKGMVKFSFVSVKGSSLSYKDSMDLFLRERWELIPTPNSFVQQTYSHFRLENNGSSVQLSI